MSGRGRQSGNRTSDSLPSWLRTLSVAFALLYPAVPWAIGLGELFVSSGPGEPLVAEIRLLSVDPRELETINARIAPPSDFAWEGLERSSLIAGLSIRPTINGAGDPVILITSGDAVTTSRLDLLVEVDAGSGRLLREVNIDLTPESSVPAPAPGDGAGQPAADPVPEPTWEDQVRQADPGLPPTGRTYRVAPIGTIPEGTRYVTRPGDSASRIASRLAPGSREETERLTAEIFESNRHAFINGDIDLLMTGVPISIPPGTREVQDGITVAEVSPVVKLPEHGLVPQTFEIAPLPSRAVEQIPDHNPENGPPPLAGAVTESWTRTELRVDPDGGTETVEVTPREPDIVRPVAVAFDQPASGGDASGSAESETNPDARLSIMSEEGEKVEAGAYTIASSQYIANLEQTVTLARELAESRGRQIENLETQQDRTEGVIDKQQRLIDLQAAKIEDLQDKLSVARTTAAGERPFGILLTVIAILSVVLVIVVLSGVLMLRNASRTGDSGNAIPGPARPVLTDAA